MRHGALAWLDWYAQMGVVDSVGEPHDAATGAAWPSQAPAPVLAQTASPLPTGRPAVAAGREGERTAHARAVAAACGSITELEQALATFDACPLRETATRLCFADGDPNASLMLIGEAPGAEEDRQGKPFVGPSGQLLDRMLAAIGLDRRQVWITNLIFWRPPGNRPPTTTEVATCQPFLERQIDLLAPRLILFLGGSAAKALLDVTDGVTRLRGRRFDYRTATTGDPIPALVTFHPAYLLRQPLHKRLVWRDLLTLRSMLAGGTPM